MTNPFYIQPGNNFAPHLAGLAQTIGDVGREKKSEARFKEVQGAMMDAWNSGDPKKMAEVSIQYPEARESMQVAFGFTNDQSKQASLETYRNILSDPDNALAHMEQGITRVSEAGGEPMNMLTDLGILKRDPQAALRSIEMGYASVASPQEWKAYQAHKGIGTNATRVGAQEILPDGTIIQSTTAGPRVFAPDGRELRGTEAASAVKTAQEYGVDLTVNKAGGRTEASERAKGRVADIGDTLARVDDIRANMAIYDEMEAALDAGANTGKLSDWAPSVKSSTLRFQNAARTLGLGVISAGKFGALSEKELELAMETAVPKLEEGEMRKWIAGKRDAQRKLAQELENYALFVDEGGSKADWIRRQRKIKEERLDRIAGGDIQRDPVEQAADENNKAQAESPYPEGTIIRNPKTGERLIMQNGQWSPVGG